MPTAEQVARAAHARASREARTPPFNPEELGANLLLARELRNWSQLDLAEKARVSKFTISRIEHGRNAGLTVDTLVRLANALGMSLDQLLNRKGRIHAKAKQLQKAVPDLRKEFPTEEANRQALQAQQQALQRQQRQRERQTLAAQRRKQRARKPVPA